MSVMTLEQQELVSQNLNVVDIIIRRYITVRPDIPGMEYDDLYQIGSLALCKAAAHFDGRCKFTTFASTVVKNDLISHCRLCCRGIKSESLDKPTNEDDTLTLMDLLSSENVESGGTLRESLAAVKVKYNGCTLNGIEAMEMKLMGYSGAEIAKYYGVKNNMVTAWISRAAQRLRNDAQFVESVR